MTARRILVLALATQCGLMALAWWASIALDVSLRWGAPLRDGLIGLGVAVTLAAGNFALLTRAPRNWIVDGVREVYHETLVPLFGTVSPAGVVALGVAAGVGEEWLFRGVLQPLVGLGASTVLFGLAHVGGRRMLPFGVWAMGMGLVMGLLTIFTGGIVAAMVAHGVYDMLALEYIRRGAHRA